jgi:hypothetical protein
MPQTLPPVGSDVTFVLDAAKVQRFDAASGARISN